MALEPKLPPKTNTRGNSGLNPNFAFASSLEIILALSFMFLDLVL